jgi:hypothetical protein
VLLTRQKKIDTLYRAKKEMEAVSDKESTLLILAEAGDTVGYRPAVRVLVKNKEPETALK